MTSTSTDDPPLITCRPTSPTKLPLPFSSIPTGHLYSALAPSYVANTNRLAPPGLHSDFSEGSSSSSTLPPPISPSLLIPLSETPPSPPSPPFSTGSDALARSSSPQSHQETKSQYQQALERLEQANLQDTQMLSSFKREYSILLPRPHCHPVLTHATRDRELPRGVHRSTLSPLPQQCRLSCC